MESSRKLDTDHRSCKDFHERLHKTLFLLKAPNYDGAVVSLSYHQKIRLEIWSCFIDKVAINCEIQRCTSLYQFFTTNWLCVFTAQLLPGRNLGSKSTFPGLLFIFSSNTFYFSPNLYENEFWLATISNSNVLICY